MSKTRKITITIAENIRSKPYEILKPTISVEYEVPDGWEVQEYYELKYREVKRIWNMHLYNMVYNTEKRTEIGDIKEYAKEMVLGKESFPVFKLTKKGDDKP
tara:strand:+ start:2805 stop:3110 length:306 start_codon:yes stop_codon:yes gene_type:complete